MKRLINILDIIGNESCLSAAKHELLLDNAPELSAFPVEYECHYEYIREHNESVPDSVTPSPNSLAVMCWVEICRHTNLEFHESESILVACTADAIAYEEKNWTNIFADDTFEISWLEEENYEEDV